MKRKVLTVVMMMTVVMVWAQSPRAVIRSVEGTVEVKAAGTSVWRPAVIGQELEKETQVSTGFKSAAMIEIGNSKLTVRPLTRLSVGELEAATAAADRVDLRLSAGRVRAEVKPPVGGKDIDFTVRGPAVTASVRGTVFDFDTVNLEVEEGTVAFSGADNTAVYVGGGESSSPDPVSGKATAPVGTAAALAPPPAGVETVTIAPELMSAALAPVDVGLGWED
jgi:hypothetical protein